MWKFKELKPKKDDNIIVEYLKEEQIPASFFTSPYTLNMFLNHDDKKIYLASNGTKKRLFILRSRHNNVVRILFEKKDDEELICKIKAQFDPIYIVYNLLSKKPSKEDIIEPGLTEMVLDIKTVANLEDKKIKKGYDKFLRRHPGIEFVPIKEFDKNKIFDFLDEWSRIVSEKWTYSTTAQNDKVFIGLYLDDPNVGGGVAIDDNKIVGLVIYSTSYKKGDAIGIITKSLREYKELGVWLYVNRSLSMIKDGYKKEYIGELQKNSKGDFKKKFSLNSEIIKLYSYEEYRRDDLKTKGDFLNALA